MSALYHKIYYDRILNTKWCSLRGSAPHAVQYARDKMGCILFAKQDSINRLVSCSQIPWQNTNSFCEFIDPTNMLIRDPQIHISWIPILPLSNSIAPSPKSLDIESVSVREFLHRFWNAAVHSRLFRGQVGFFLYVFQFCNQIVWLAQVACFARGYQVLTCCLLIAISKQTLDHFLANLACKTFISACYDRPCANSNIVLYKLQDLCCEDDHVWS